MILFFAGLLLGLFIAFGAYMLRLALKGRGVGLTDLERAQLEERKRRAEEWDAMMNYSGRRK